MKRAGRAVRGERSFVIVCALSSEAALR